MKKIIVAFAFLGACATAERGASHVSAKVSTLQSGSVQPLAGAHVAVQCPNGEVRELGRTGTDGTLSVDADHAPGLDCNLIVSEAGYRLAILHVFDACTQSELGPCTDMDISAVLQRSAGSAGDAS